MDKRANLNLLKSLNPGKWGKSVSSGASKAMNQIKDLAKGDVGKWVAIFGIASVVQEFSDSIIDYLRDLRVQAKSSTYYNKMLENNRQLLDENPEDVAKLWASLYHNSPHLAQDPTAAGAFIKQSLDKELLSEYGGPPIDVYKTLSDIESKYSGNTNRSSDKYINTIINALADPKSGVGS